MPAEEVVLLLRERVFPERARLVGGNEFIDEEERIAVRQQVDAGEMVLLLELRKFHVASSVFLEDQDAVVATEAERGGDGDADVFRDARIGV